MTTRTPRVGHHVLVMVPRSTNGGLDHAPATVTRVHKQTGKVNLHALVDVGNPIRIDRAQLVADRAAALAVLEEHFKHLPAGRAEPDDDGDLVMAPGVNSMTGEPWHRSDVAHWHAVAYWPTDADADPVDVPAPAPVETQADTIARLERELAAARATGE